ncbi:hypothetical protein F66182_4399 [Fusarium sp. NRRL 66182]|nr:hypothetical protein F66182_4399 [Fusarium sp. NRRL 66182]
MSSSAVLVLGGTGPAGICLLRELIYRNHKVVAYARNAQKIPEDVASSPLIEIIQGQLNDAEALDTAVSKTNVVVSILGPTSNSRSADPDVLADFYKSFLFPAMRKHGVKRIIAMGTVSLYAPEDGFSFIRSAFVLFVRLVMNGAYNAIVNIARAFENDAKDLDWTIFRIAVIPGGSDKESWEKDRLDGKTFIGSIGQKGQALVQPRAALARSLVDGVEGALDDWIQKMPVVTKLAGS